MGGVEFLHRNTESLGNQLLGHFPITVIQGARQVGKSTLAQILGKQRGAQYYSLDDVSVRDSLIADPVGFIDSHASQTLIIDEVQLLPELLRAVKASVDQDRRPGRFLLTGSANLLRLYGDIDSLAGRAVTLRLRGFSQGELHSHTDDFIHKIHDADFNPLSFSSSWAKNDYAHALATGGFPDVSALPEPLQFRWFDGYLSRVLERDAAVLSGGSQTQRITTLASLIAANQAGELVKARLSEQAGIPQSSIQTYLDVLDSIYLCDQLPPWTPNLTKREVGRKKTMISDSGLAMHMAALTAEQISGVTSKAMGGVLEAFVVQELLKQQEWSRKRYTLSHYRDRNGIEVDVIVELSSGEIYAFEVKASATYKADQFRGLTYLRDKLGDRFLGGFVLGTAPQGYRFADKLWGLPVSALWSI